MEKQKRFRLRSGFSLVELLVAVAVLAVLILLMLMSFGKQVSRSRDAERKTDLERIKVAFEDFYNDNGCYPPADVLENCNGLDFQPYLQSIPCDPLDGEPYYYVPLEADGCKGYRVYTGLEVNDDPAIGRVGCDGPDGCGYGAGFNYGISAGVTVYDEDAVPFPSPSPSAPAASPSLPASPVSSPSPSPSGPIYVYACDLSGTCNQFEDGHPALVFCPVTFQATDCNNACADPAVQCSGVVN